MRSLNRSRLFAVAFVAAAFSCLVSTVSAQAWYSTDRWGNWNNGGYTLYNNVWGSGYGPQTIWANSFSNWGVWANHPNSGGIKSYPNVTRYVGRRVSAINTLRASFSATTPPGGAWAAAFDLWDTNHAYEIMLWMNYTGTANGGGNVKPISYNWNSAGNAVPVYTNLSIGGHTWNIFRGHNGGNEVFSFLRTTKTNNATVDLKAVFNWLRTQGWIGDVTVGDVQYGFEITSTDGGKDYRVNSYSVTSN